eukprot:4882040-Amphidinium_carterae.1
MGLKEDRLMHMLTMQQGRCNETYAVSLCLQDFKEPTFAPVPAASSVSHECAQPCNLLACVPRAGDTSIARLDAQFQSSPTVPAGA